MKREGQRKRNREYGARERERERERERDTDRSHEANAKRSSENLSVDVNRVARERNTRMEDFEDVFTSFIGISRG